MHVSLTFKLRSSTFHPKQEQKKTKKTKRGRGSRHEFISWWVCCVFERALQWNSHWSKNCAWQTGLWKKQISKIKAGLRLNWKRKKNANSRHSLCLSQLVRIITSIKAHFPPHGLPGKKNHSEQTEEIMEREAVIDYLSTGWRSSLAGPLAGPLRLLEPLFQTNWTGSEPPPPPTATTWTYALFFDACCCSHDALPPSETSPAPPKKIDSLKNNQCFVLGRKKRKKRHTEDVWLVNKVHELDFLYSAPDVDKKQQQKTTTTWCRFFFSIFRKRISFTEDAPNIWFFFFVYFLLLFPAFRRKRKKKKKKPHLQPPEVIGGKNKLQNDGGKNFPHCARTTSMLKPLTIS